MISNEATKHFKRQCEYKRLEVLSGLLKKGDSVLDVGCGIGTYTSTPLAYLPVSITAIDSDKKTVDYASERNQHENLEFLCACGEYFDDDEQYDLIVCSHILEHTPVPIVLLGNMKRLLKDDGVLVLAIPNGYGVFELQNCIPRLLLKTAWGKRLITKMLGNKAKDTLNMDSPHIHFFTVDKIKKLLKLSGWQIINQVNDEFLGGIVFDRIFAKLPAMARWNVGIADSLPAQWTNGWIFVCEKKK